MEKGDPKTDREAGKRLHHFGDPTGTGQENRERRRDTRGRGFLNSEISLLGATNLGLERLYKAIHMFPLLKKAHTGESNLRQARFDLFVRIGAASLGS